LLKDECNTYRKTLHSRTKGLFNGIKIETTKHFNSSEQITKLWNNARVSIRGGI